MFHAGMYGVVIVPVCTDGERFTRVPVEVCVAVRAVHVTAAGDSKNERGTFGTRTGVALQQGDGLEDVRVAHMSGRSEFATHATHLFPTRPALI